MTDLNRDAAARSTQERPSRGRRAFAGLALILACAATSWTATATPAGAVTATVAPATSEAAAAKAPCIVTGYTLHAEEQMAARRISSDYVENVVYKYCSKATRRTSNNTWQYTDGKIIVSANDNGYVVTVIRR